MDIYGVLDSSGCHVDVSNTERGAKMYATKNNFLTVTVRYNCGYIAEQIAHKYTGKWQKVRTNETR
jgi:hypothetical protein